MKTEMQGSSKYYSTTHVESNVLGGGNSYRPSVHPVQFFYLIYSPPLSLTKMPLFSKNHTNKLMDSHSC
jgi:hypothetical protein